MWKSLFKEKSHPSQLLAKQERGLVCPKTGKPLGHNRKYRWLKWLFPITGLLSLIWFVIRVVPKPSRATYPCQRVAFPLASGFIVWLLGLAGSAAAYRKAKRSFAQARYVLAAICIVASVGFIWAALSSTDEKITYGGAEAHALPILPSVSAKVFTQVELPGFTIPMPPTGPVPAQGNAGIQAPALTSRLSMKCSQMPFGH